MGYEDGVAVSMWKTLQASVVETREADMVINVTKK